jgi:hypothetical protein
MLCFIFRKNPGLVGAWGFCVFAGVFEGGFGKSGWLNVVF